MRKRRNISIGTFVADNQLLLLFLGLLLIGVAGGSTVFRAIGVEQGVSLALAVQAIPASLDTMAVAWVESMLMPSILIAVLFLSGLTVFGIPVILAVPLFFGLGIGLTQGSYYAQGPGGMGLACLLILPRFSVVSVGVLMACAESFRMSARLGRQLLPGGAIGSLWIPFRLYLLRFVLFVGIAMVAATVDVAVRVACAAML